MRLQCHDILPALRPYLKLICTMEAEEAMDTQMIKVLPDTCVELFINYTNSPIAMIEKALHHRSIVSFRMSKPMDVQMRKGAGCMAICFHPGMAYPFFRMPMHELSNKTIALAELWPAMAANLEDELSGLYTHAARVALVQKYLLQQLASNYLDQQVGHCLQQAQLSGGSITVNELSAQLGLSQRQLSRKFQENIGLSPKAYLRVSRFVQSLAQLKKYPALSLTAIACESGYYDQAHFIRDYQTYTGHSPGEVFSLPHILC